MCGGGTQFGGVDWVHSEHGWESLTKATQESQLEVSSENEGPILVCRLG